MKNNSFILENEIGKLKNEIARLETVILQKESTIKYLCEGKKALYEEACTLRKKLEENKTPSFYKLWKKNNKAIYDALITLLRNNCIFIPLMKWDEETLKLQNDLTQQLINNLIKERDLNND